MTTRTTPHRLMMTASFLAVGFLAAVLTACNLPAETTPSDQNDDPQIPVYDFGDHYNLLQRDSVPRLQGDSLYVDLGYDCNSGAAITLEHFKTGNSSYEIWLNMADRGPQCAMPIIDRRAFKVPDEVKNALSVQLVTRDTVRIELKN